MGRISYKIYTPSFGGYRGWYVIDTRTSFPVFSISPDVFGTKAEALEMCRKLNLWHKEVIKETMKNKKEVKSKNKNRRVR